MTEQARKLGIDVLDEAPWGTHLCHFYDTKEDLIDVLVPYFMAGLENNESCIWVTSEPLKAEAAKASLNKAVENLDHYIKKGQIEILDSSEWYSESGQFDIDEVLRDWIKKKNQALERGFDGLRITGNTSWVEKSHWNGFHMYERAVDNAIGRHRMLAMCSYCLDKCGASELIDVVNTHGFALIKRQGKWELLESTSRRRAKELGSLSTYLQATRDDERATVAREVHDDIGQALAAVKMNLWWLRENLPEDPKTFLEITASMMKQMDTAVRSSEKIASKLRPALLNHLGLIVAIEWMLRKFQERTGIKCEFSPDPRVVMQEDIVTPVFRIFEEALNNVDRHANATKVEVRVKQKAETLMLTVSDNGQGITQEHISDSKSVGLLDMRQRAWDLGGKVKITGSRKKGTTVTVSIPFDNQ